MTTATHPPRRHSGSLAPILHSKPIALRLPQDELSEAHAMADGQDRSTASFARLVYLMGMQMHRRTGLLRLPEHAVDAVVDAVAKTADAGPSSAAHKA